MQKLRAAGIFAWGAGASASGSIHSINFDSQALGPQTNNSNRTNRARLDLVNFPSTGT